MSYKYLGFTNSSDVVQYRTLPINVDTNSEQRFNAILKTPPVYSRQY